MQHADEAIVVINPLPVKYGNGTEGKTRGTRTCCGDRRVPKGHSGCEGLKGTRSPYGNRINGTEGVERPLECGKVRPSGIKRHAGRYGDTNRINRRNEDKIAIGLETSNEVRDRVVRQAVVNVIEPIFDPTFHPSSYGYRPKRSQHHAVAKAESFINRYGLTEVADMDLGRCSGTLDHGIIMDTAAERISDGRVPAPTRKFLKSGVMKKDTFEATGTGSCQGGVISPLLSNIYLNKFDQKMMSGGIRIVRHADDIPIFSIDKRRATA